MKIVIINSINQSFTNISSLPKKYSYDLSHGNKCTILLFNSIFRTTHLPMLKLIKLAKMAGVMHEADHADSIRSTW